MSDLNSLFQPRSFRNPKTGADFRLLPAPLLPSDDAALERIAGICNEPLVYDNLFRSVLDGAPYTVEKSKVLFEWAEKGWKSCEYFVFLIVDEAGTVIGAIDIKSNRLERAEVGYWLSAYASGGMSGALATLCEAAKSAGFLSLFAHVDPTNGKSIAVLLRGGFAQEPGLVQSKGKDRFVFSKLL